MLLNALCHTALLHKPSSLLDWEGAGTCLPSAHATLIRSCSTRGTSARFQYSLPPSVHFTPLTWPMGIIRGVFAQATRKKKVSQCWSAEKLAALRASSTRTHLLSKAATSDAKKVRSITSSLVPVYIIVRLEWTVLLNVIKCFIISTLASSFHANPLLSFVSSVPYLS